MTEKKKNNFFQNAKKIMSKQEKPKLDYIPVNELLQMYINYSNDLNEFQELNKGFFKKVCNWDIFFLRDLIIFFDKYELFDIIIEGVDDGKVNQIIEQVNKNHKEFLLAFSNIFGIKVINLIHREMIIEFITFFIKTLGLIYMMLGNLKDTKKFRGGNMIVSKAEADAEKAKHGSKYHVTFFSPEYKLYDMEMMFDSIICELLKSSDTEQRIKDRNAIYSVYKYCKLRANNG